MLKYIQTFIFMVLISGCASKHIINPEYPFAKAVMKKRIIGGHAEGEPQLVPTQLTERECEEWYRLGNPKEQAIYHLEEKDFIPGKTYTLYSATIFKKTKIREFVVNNECKLISLKDQIPLSIQTFPCSDFIKGEEISYVLVSESEDEFIIATATPDPIETKWDDGANVSIVVLSPTLDLFLEKGKGFNPGEKISLISCSNSEEILVEINIPENGEFISFLEPATKSSDSGHSTTVIKRENTGEERTLKYSYGKQVIYDALKDRNFSD